MNIARALSALVLVCCSGAAAQTPTCEVGDPRLPAGVDVEFAYPEARETVDLGTILVRSLAGRVVDAQGIPVERVLIERVSVRGRRLDATVTDANGCFRLGRVRDGQHSLRVSYPGFDTLVLQARTGRGNSRDFELTLLPST